MLKENSWINVWIKLCRHYWQQKHRMVLTLICHLLTPFSQTDFTLPAVTIEWKTNKQVAKVHKWVYLSIPACRCKINVYSFVQTSEYFQPFTNKHHEKYECKTKKEEQELNWMLMTEGQSLSDQLIKTI